MTDLKINKIIKDVRSYCKWFNEKYQRTIDDRDKAKLLMITTPNMENNRNFAQKLREAKCAIRREKQL